MNSDIPKPSLSVGAPMASSESSSLLEGVRILSFGAFVAGNLCPLLLAEVGADVVKVESPTRPEALRNYESPGHRPVAEPSGSFTCALFAGLARSTRSIGIEMATSDGVRIFRDLVRHADVVIENLGPGTLENWGCSAAELHQLNPSLVVLSMSGYGRSGPLARYRAYASNINNHLGLTAVWALDGTHFDFVAAFHGAVAVAAALAAVRRGSDGVTLDLAQTEAGASVMAPLYLDFLANGREWQAQANEVPGSALSTVVRCRGEDAWLAVELEDLADWQTMCGLLERDDLAVEEPSGIAGRRLSLDAAIAGWASKLTPLQATVSLQRAGLAAGPVQNTEDLWRDPQLRSRDSFVEIDHPDLGGAEYPNALDRLSRSPGRVARRAPRLGEHTAEVLQEWLGLDGTTIGVLEQSGGVWQLHLDAQPRAREA